MLRDHLEGILSYCRTKVPTGVIETVNGNLKALLRRAGGQDRIPRASESRVICAFIKILVQIRFLKMNPKMSSLFLI